MEEQLEEQLEEQWRQHVENWVREGRLQQATLSGPRRKDGSVPPQTIVRPIALKGERHYQFETRESNKALHYNATTEETIGRLSALMAGSYRQAFLRTDEAEVQLLFSKKGRASIRTKPLQGGKSVNLEHDRSKRRVLPPGQAVPFLVELGIMTPDGAVRAKKQDKYRQINRFLEMVADVLHYLPEDREITIVDFGCGKSYLTFALYHLLAVEQGRPISVTGLDLKAEVVAFCSELAQKLDYRGLRFLQGDIAEYEGLSEADMVVTLHACDTATDAALAKAVHWGASVILSVPCCQHELFKQVESEELAPILSYGLLKERFAAIATDAARGKLLETLGYKVHMLEFVDPEHTPKNLLIRAVASGKRELSEEKWRQYEAFRNYLHLSPALERALADEWTAFPLNGAKGGK